MGRKRRGKEQGTENEREKGKKYERIDSAWANFCCCSSDSDSDSRASILPMIVPKNTLESGNSAVPFRPSIGNKCKCWVNIWLFVCCWLPMLLQHTQLNYLIIAWLYQVWKQKRRAKERPKEKKRRRDKSTSFVNKTLTRANEREREYCVII